MQVASPAFAARLPYVRQELEWRPFQRDVLVLVAKASDGRTIYWIYSLQGKLGKSTLANWLVEKRDALVISATAEADVKDLIRRKKEEEGLFEEHPIIIVDVPRAASDVVQKNKLYQVLESIMGSFHSTKRDGAVVRWTRGQEPHVLVFANDTPDPHRISGDRLDVYLVTKSHELAKATHVHKQIDAFAARTNALQEEEEAAAASGERPPRLAMRKTHGDAAGSGDSDADHVRSPHAPLPLLPASITTRLDPCMLTVRAARSFSC